MLDQQQSAGKHFVIIRRALQTELDSICELNTYLNKLNAERFDPYVKPEWSVSGEGKQYFTDRLSDPDGLFLVAVDLGTFVGYLNVRKYEGEQQRVNAVCAELENMMVLPQYQNKGIGTKMMEIFFNWCREQGVQRIKASVYAKNAEAVAYYKHFGFAELTMIMEMQTPPAPDITVTEEIQSAST